MLNLLFGFEGRLARGQYLLASLCVQLVGLAALFAVGRDFVSRVMARQRGLTDLIELDLPDVVLGAAGMTLMVILLAAYVQVALMWKRARDAGHTWLASVWVGAALTPFVFPALALLSWPAMSISGMCLVMWPSKPQDEDTGRVFGDAMAGDGSALGNGFTRGYGSALGNGFARGDADGIASDLPSGEDLVRRARELREEELGAAARDTQASDAVTTQSGRLGRDAVRTAVRSVRPGARGPAGLRPRGKVAFGRR